MMTENLSRWDDGRCLHWFSNSVTNKLLNPFYVVVTLVKLNFQVFIENESAYLKCSIVKNTKTQSVLSLATQFCDVSPTSYMRTN